MSDYKPKANQLVEDAMGRLRGTSGFFSCFRGASEEDEGLEMLCRAASLYKMSKAWVKAGDTLTLIGEHHVKKRAKHSAATNFVEAAKCYKKTDREEASQSLLKAIDIYTYMGRFLTAAKHHQTMAEMFEDNVTITETVIHHYQIAADYFKGEEMFSSANTCLEKVAQYAASQGECEKAIKIYVEVSVSCFLLLY